MVEQNVRVEVDLNRTNFWFQVLTGNWTPSDAKAIYPLLTKEGPVTEKPFWFSTSAVLATLVNLGALVATFEIMRRVMTLERRQAMKLTELLIMRDRVIKEAMYNALIKDRQSKNIREINDLIGIVEGAFSAGNEEWKEDYFAILFSPKEISEEESLMTKEEQANLQRAQENIRKQHA